jgi:hypothetical protein
MFNGFAGHFAPCVRAKIADGKQSNKSNKRTEYPKSTVENG